MKKGFRKRENDFYYTLEVKRGNPVSSGKFRGIRRWQWTLHSRNGYICGKSGPLGFGTKKSCIQGFGKLVRLLGGGKEVKLEIHHTDEYQTWQEFKLWNVAK